MIKTTLKNISELSENTGQIDGLQTNPRKITKKAIEKLKKSIQDNPEMLELREIITYKNVIIAGNMRYKACKELNLEQIPCKELPEDTPVEVLKAITIKDNLPFGEWDFELIKEWDISELDDFGFDVKQLDFIPDETLEFLDYSEKEKENDYFDSQKKDNALVLLLNKEDMEKWEKKKKKIGIKDDLKAFRKLLT